MYYRIRKFELKGETFYGYDTIEGDIKNDSNCRYYTLSKEPKGVNLDTTNYLPYFANVVEDLPGWLKSQPKVYKNCQLTTQLPNNHLVFYHPATKQHLKIAMNSHYYIPLP